MSYGKKFVILVGGGMKIIQPPHSLNILAKCSLSCLQIGFIIAFCLEKTSEQKILAMGVLKELFLIAIIVNLLVPPTFYSLALVLNSMLIFLLGRRFFLQVSERWMRENSVRKWKDLLKNSIKLAH
ncbi:hypothetical protein P3G55_08640 [Leptospira sp. 96542]|nr:hypothetical protein [Leptospira sp. 96542]